MIKKGDIILVEVTGFTSYGVFVKKDDYTGLIHISEISDKFVRDINLFASVGDLVSAYVIEINEEQKQLTLSYKLCKSKRQIIVSEFKIGFEPFKQRLSKMIKQAKKELEEGAQ
ncbi:MAG: S1 RNA-binding domain-containing protein [Acholeplasmataceae bacterium]|nr:S1 RNA-binding domain-containing protein [Acholeplasmataceae bacterium]